MNLDELKKILRGDFAYIIRDVLIKDKCEICGSDDKLELHHTKPFSILLEETLEELNIDLNKIDDIKLDMIKNIMIGKQIRHKNITACKKCHLNIHKEEHRSFSNIVDDYYKSAGKKRIMKKQQEKIKADNIQSYLANMVHNKIVLLTRKDREGLIQTINTRKNGRILNGIGSLNSALDELNIPYRICEFMTNRVIDGKKKKFKAAWKIEEIMIA